LASEPFCLSDFENAALYRGGVFFESAHAGRRKCVSLACDQVAAPLEALMGLAAGTGHLRTRTDPRDQALCEARECYTHLAREWAKRLPDSRVIAFSATGKTAFHQAFPTSA